MYSGDVPAILSARKTYSFRGIELTPLSLLWLARQASPPPPPSPPPCPLLVPLYVYVTTPDDGVSFFVSFCSRIARGIFPLIRGSRVLRSVFFGWNPARFLSTERRKYTIFMWFDEYILMLTVVEQFGRGNFFSTKKTNYFQTNE